MPTISKLITSLGIDSNQFTAGLDQAGQKFLTFKNLLGTSSLGMSAGFAAITGAVAASVKAGMDFQDAYGQLAAKTGNTGVALDSLKRSFDKIFVGVTQDANQVGSALGTLQVRTGLTGRKLEELAVQEARLARVTGQDLTETVNSTVLAMNKWSISSDQMGRRLDTLLAISQRTGVGVNQLSENLRRMGAPLQDMGLSFDRAAQMLGNWDKAGLNVSQTTFGLRFAMNQLVAAGVKPTAENLEYLLGKIEAHKNSVKAAAEMTNLFGKRSGEELLAALRKGQFGVADFTRQIDEAAGAVKRTDDNVNPLKRSLTELMHSFESAIRPTSGFSNELKTVIDGLKDLLTWLSKTNQEIDKGSKGVLGIGRGGKASMWERMFGSSPAQKEEIELATGSNFTDKMKKDLSLGRSLEEMWRGMGVGVREADKSVAAHKETVKQTVAEHQKLDAILAGKPKKHHDTPYEKELKQLTELTARATIQLKELDEGENETLAHLLGRFRLLNPAMVEHYSHILAQIKAHKDQEHAILRWKNAMDESKARVIELKNELQFGKSGMFNAEALRSAFHGLVSDTLIEGLVKEKNLEKELTEELEKQRKLKERQIQLDRESSRKLSDLHAEYLKLTHTRYEDQVALELYGKTFSEVTDGQHRDRVQQIVFWLRTVEAQRELNRETDRMKNADKELAKNTEELTLKLTQKSTVEDEAARKTQQMLVPYDKLPAAIRQVEAEELATIRFNKALGDLTETQKKEIDANLRAQHALAIKTKSERDAAALAKEQERISKELTVRLGELISKEEFLLGINKQKQSSFIINMELLRAQGKLTKDQIKILDEIEAREKKLPGLERHAKLIHQMTESLRSEFTKLFEDLAMGHKNVFQTIEQDFRKMLASMAAEYLASRLANLIQRLVGGMLGGDATTLTTRAAGGPLASGQLALVGENGPELFMPNTAGRIIPNDRMSRGGSTNVYVTVHAADANSFHNSRNQIGESMLRAMEIARMRNGA